MPSKEYHELIEKCKAIHDSKSHDYAPNDDPFSNFKFAAEIVSHFTNPIDQVFAGIIGIKLARIAELSNGKTPNNESLQDSYIDLTNYSALWGAYYLAKEKVSAIEFQMEKGIGPGQELLGIPIKVDPTMRKDEIRLESTCNYCNQPLSYSETIKLFVHRSCQRLIQCGFRKGHNHFFFNYASGRNISITFKNINDEELVNNTINLAIEKRNE